MRELKFRAWNKEQKRFGYINLNDEAFDYTWLTCELSQYTGLKDNNGVEAYQDDLYRPWDDDRIYKIVWDDDNARFKLNQISGNKWRCDMMMIPYSDGGIIGNIYDNPELLDTN